MSALNRKFKPIADQVIVITGATSGIGLATAKMAARRGAKVVLASRNGKDLDAVVDEIHRSGGEAFGVVTDVSIVEDLENLRDEALEIFGRIDTWVNNAGISIFGKSIDTSLLEEEELFDTNYWGVRNGSRVAIEAMRESGGVIINVGSEVSMRSVPLQGTYSATKHAVKAYTDALRIELEHDKIPIAVSLIRPAGIDTPFTLHAVNRLESGEPSLPAPVYHPDVAARAILASAERPQRDIYVGGPARLFAILETLFPRVLDQYMKHSLFEQQSKGGRVPHTREDEALMKPAEHEGQLRGGHRGWVHPTSFYTFLATRPSIGLIVGGLVAFALTRETKKVAPQARNKFHDLRDWILRRPPASSSLDWADA